jgi:hypothetical protein
MTPDAQHHTVAEALDAALADRARLEAELHKWRNGHQLGGVQEELYGALASLEEAKAAIARLEGERDRAQVERDYLLAASSDMSLDDLTHVIEDGLERLSVEIGRQARERCLESAALVEKADAALAAMTQERDAANAGYARLGGRLSGMSARALAAEQSLAEVRGALEWRPIETVPKDGTRVMLSPAKWTTEGVVTAYQRGGLWWIENADIRGGMRAFTLPEEDDTHWPFTHWMPLPALPPPAPPRLAGGPVTGEVFVSDDAAPRRTEVEP